MLQYFCSIINGARAHRPGRSGGGAHGGHSASPRQSLRLSKPPTAPKSPRPLPREQGTGTHGLWGRLLGGWSKALTAPKKVPAAAQRHPAGRGPWTSGPGVSEANGKISGVKPLSMGPRASFCGVLPNGPPSTAVKVGGKQQRSAPPPPDDTHPLPCRSRALLLPGVLGGAGMVWDCCSPRGSWRGGGRETGSCPAAAGSRGETLLPSSEPAVNTPREREGLMKRQPPQKCTLPVAAGDRHPEKPPRAASCCPSARGTQAVGVPRAPRRRGATNSRFDDLAQVISVGHLGRLVIILLVSQRHAAKRHRRARCWQGRERW